MSSSRRFDFSGADANVKEAPGLPSRAALTGCPWHDVKSMLREVGLRPTRQRMALGWMLFGKGDRHVTAEMLYEEAVKAKVTVSLATIYNTLHQFTDAGLLRQVAVDGSKPILTPTCHSIITSSSKARTISWIFRIRMWLSGGRRSPPKATLLRASMWWCDCAASLVPRRPEVTRYGSFGAQVRSRSERNGLETRAPAHSNFSLTYTPQSCSCTTQPSKRAPVIRHQEPLQRFTEAITPA